MVDGSATAFVANDVVNCPTVIVWDRIARFNEHAFRGNKRSEWVHQRSETHGTASATEKIQWRPGR